MLQIYSIIANLNPLLQQLSLWHHMYYITMDEEKALKKPYIWLPMWLDKPTYDTSIAEYKCFLHFLVILIWQMKASSNLFPMWNQNLNAIQVDHKLVFIMIMYTQQERLVIIMFRHVWHGNSDT